MRRLLSVTGSRADYGLMEPVHRALRGDSSIELHLAVTAMHLLPAFAASLEQVRADRFGQLHEVAAGAPDDSGAGMARAVGSAILGFAPLLERVRPDLVLLHGDRGEMLAAGIAAAHMNVPLLHMSGGDRSGSIDDCVRNALSKLAHFHLTSCASSSQQLEAMGESADRIREVGDPAIDCLRSMDYLPREALAEELGADLAGPYLVATLHPVSDEADRAASQMSLFLDALAATGLPAVVTYPNSDAGGRAMAAELESRRGRKGLHIFASLGSRRYLSVLRHAAAIVGNSSSGIIESPFFPLPAVNVGSRQHGRLRASNIVDVELDRQAIARAIAYVQHDAAFRQRLRECRNPFGDGHAAERTVDTVQRLRLDRRLTAKWRWPAGSFLDAGPNA